MKAIVIEQHGGPEVLQLVDRPMPAVNGEQVLVENRAIGVNFVDTQHRAGTPYPIGLPLIPGIEAVGVVTAVGQNVHEFKIGDRVGYAGYMGGNYAECTLVPESKLIPIPADVNDECAAAALMQGMTAHALAYNVYPIQKGDTVLIQAGAGGVGLFLLQLAKRRGATVITTVSNETKAEFARAYGADHTIVYTKTDFEKETMKLTDGQGAQVVYDAVGRNTFDQGIRVLRAQGVMVVNGLTSGSVPLFDINRLSGITGAGSRGSLFLTWATLSDYTARQEELLWRAKDVLTWVGDGSLKTQIAHTLPLHKAAEAHRLLESRQTVGKVLLIP